MDKKIDKSLFMFMGLSGFRIEELFDDDETSEHIAKDWLADEMSLFINNTKDFMSATVEQKEKVPKEI